MADVKISELTALASASADVAGDVLAIVDTSVPQTKKITVENLVAPITLDKSNLKVGIGETSPQSNLHISDTASTGVMLSDTNAGSNVKNYQMYSDSGLLGFRRLTDAYSGYSPTMVIKESNVGIGTDSPDNNMHIASTSSETGMIIQSNLGGTGSAIGGQIKLALGARNNSGSGQADTQAGDVLGQIMFEGQGTDFSYQGGNIKTIVTTGDGNDNRSNQETAMTFETIAVGSVSPAEQLRLTGDGDLGLGDNSPSTALTSFGSASRGLSIKNVQPTIALTDTDATGHFWIANVGGQSYFQNNVSGSIFRFLTSDGEKLRILNGGGITFNGDTAAANALDDYEEGTWTPQLANAASGGTLAGTSTAVARYTKIGDKVHIQGYVVCNSQSGISGSAFVYLRNIPYVSHSTSNLYSAGTIGYAQGLDITATGHISLNLDHNGSAYAALNSWDVSTGTSQLTFDELSTDGGFIFQMTYVTN